MEKASACQCSLPCNDSKSIPESISVCSLPVHGNIAFCFSDGNHSQSAVQHSSSASVSSPQTTCMVVSKSRFGDSCVVEFTGKHRSEQLRVIMRHGGQHFSSTSSAQPCKPCKPYPGPLPALHNSFSAPLTSSASPCNVSASASSTHRPLPLVPTPPSSTTPPLSLHSSTSLPLTHPMYGECSTSVFSYQPSDTHGIAGNHGAAEKSLESSILR